MNVIVLKLISPLPPSVNHYTSVRTIMKNGKPMAIVYETKEAKKYKRNFKKIIEEQVKSQNWHMEVNDTQHFYVDAVFYFDRVDKDCSNYEKCLDDTITETQLIWKDDNVALFRPERIYYDSANPRIELTIYPVDYIGVFDDASQLEEFTSRCIGCKRYIRNCSLLAKAKEGRIQPEIHNGICDRYSAIKMIAK